MRNIETLERRQLLAWSAYASLIGQDTVAAERPTLRGQGQVVAVIDTGIDYNHPVFGGDGMGKKKKILTGYDFIQNDNDPMDTDGHGTAVSSFIAGNEFTYEGTTYRGIAPDAKLISLRAGTGRNTYTTENIVRALQWVVENREKWGITIVNMSLGGGDYADYVAGGRYGTQIAQLKEMGVFVVASSGNDSSSLIGYPGSDINIFSVGATTHSGAISDFSNRNKLVDLVAPGEQVIGAKTLTDEYEPIDGTSFATPITAGVVALIQQLEPSLSVNDVSSVLRTSSVPNRDGDDESSPQTARVYSQLDIPAALELAEERATASLDVIATTMHSTIDTVYDKNSVLHLAYFEPTTAKLMYSTRSDASGLWTTPVVVDNSNAILGQHLSIAIDQAGRPGIAYFDATNADLKYALLEGGDTWTISTIESRKSVGQFPSLAFNNINEPIVAYYAKSGDRLRFARFSTTADAWTHTTVDDAGNVGAFASLGYLENGSIGIAYADQTNGDLKYARTTGNTWTTSVAHNTNGVGNIDLRLTSKTPQIAYQDLGNADVRVAYLHKSAWRTRMVADEGNVGRNVRSYATADGTYHIVYYNSTKDGTFDATMDTSTFNYNVASTDRVGTVGRTASVSVARDGSATLVGLNRAGRQMYASELVDEV